MTFFRRRTSWLLGLWLLIAAAGVACVEGGNGADGSEPTPTPGQSPVTAVTGTATPSPTATPEPTPTPRPRRLCETDRASYEVALQDLEAAVLAEMGAYQGQWGFAFIDLDCGSTVNIHPEYVQYTASAGKLPFIIAALRAVEAGDVDFSLVEDDIELVLTVSDDFAADAVAETVSADEVREVFALAGVSEATYFRDSWRNLSMTAFDLARVWEALLRGRLLGPARTDYLLDLAAGADIPDAYETFPSPAAWDDPDIRYGQKAGYYVSDGVPYFLVGAGYLLPRDRSSLGFVAVLLASTEVEDLFEPTRRQVFPVVERFVRDALAEVMR